MFSKKKLGGVYSLYMFIKNNTLKVVIIVSTYCLITKEDEMGGVCLRLAWTTEPVSK